MPKNIHTETDLCGGVFCLPLLFNQVAQMKAVFSQKKEGERCKILHSPMCEDKNAITNTSEWNGSKPAQSEVICSRLKLICR